MNTANEANYGTIYAEIYLVQTFMVNKKYALQLFWNI